MEAQRPMYQFPERKVSHLNNFIVGLTMFILSLVVMYSGEFYLAEKGQDLEALFLFVAGLSSLSLSFSRNATVILAGNICLTVFISVIGLFSFFIQLFDLEVYWEPFFFFDRADIFFHLLLAILFFYLSLVTAREVMGEQRKYSR